MPEQYFSITGQDHTVTPLGVCADWPEAHRKTPGVVSHGNTVDVLTLSRNALEQLRADIDTQLRLAPPPPGEEGKSGNYLTIFAVGVTGKGSAADMNLEELLRACDTTHSVLMVATHVRQLTRQGTAMSLQLQNSDPNFLLGDKGFLYALGTGDEVRYNGQAHKIQKLEIREGDDPAKDVFVIRDTDGTLFEAFASELE